MLGLLSATPLDGRQSGYLRTASASADHLLTLLNDILDTSRLESGRMTLAPYPVVLRELVAEVEALMRSQAQLKGLGFEIQVEPAVPTRVMLDATRVRQVLFNLLSNAIKFTEHGQVRLEVAVSRLAPGAASDARAAVPAALEESTVDVEFRITDTGPGMDADTLARLFQRFSQGDESLSRRFGGTGLGLEISRNLARLMGGDVSVSSHVGQGSIFTFRVPLPVLPEAPDVPALARAAPPGQARTLRVLVAEDNEVNRMVMEAILSGMGHDVGFAENGEQAVQLATEQDWDIVLMDLHMPVMDGLDATRGIRSHSHARRSVVPVVALTADVFVETRERCAAAGIQAFLTKPVDTSELAACLATLVAAPR
jgi:CheY-like chemotaxis protein